MIVNEINRSINSIQFFLMKSRFIFVLLINSQKYKIKMIIASELLSYLPDRVFDRQVERVMKGEISINDVA